VKVFISSVITNFERYREAAADAIRTLGHDVVRAEDFGASADSPQQVCLQGVRQAQVVVLLLGARYGTPGPSGLSPTHEEFQEARDRCRVLVFVQRGVDAEPNQKAFIAEARAWASGTLTADFTEPADLQQAVIRELHRLELAMQAGRVDEAEMLARASALAPPDRDGHSPRLCLATVGAPRQPILRPVQLESQQLYEDLTKEALFGSARVLELDAGTRRELKQHALHIVQEHTSILIDELASVRLIRALPRPERLEAPAILEEDVRAELERGLHFAGTVLDLVDPVHRLTDVLINATVLGANYGVWRTRAEHERSRNTWSSGYGPDVVAVQLNPPSRKRAALKVDATNLADDLTVLLRRQLKS
jgi:hypothetical protein